MYFPAVTLSGAYATHASRFFENVLNRVEFDCFSLGYDNVTETSKCSERTSKVRRDFNPYIQSAVALTDTKTTYLLIHDIEKTMAKLPRFHYLIKDMLCGHMTRPSNYFGMMPIVLARKLNNDTIRVIQDGLLANLVTVISSSFRMAEQDVLKKLTLHAWRHLDALKTSFEDQSNCDAYAELSRTALVYTAGILKASGTAEFSPEIKLGQLVTRMEGLDFKLVCNYGATHSILLPLLRSLLDNNTKYSAASLYSYIMDTRKYNDTPNLYQIKCCNDGCANFDEQPCVTDFKSECCLLEKEISENKDEVMKLAKYAIAPPSRPMAQSEHEDPTEKQETG